MQDHVDENEFRQAKEKSISEKGSFAFETNFSSHDPTKSLREFKSASYKVHLVFIGMKTIEECIQRVAFRVKTGGHKVAEESIVYNFIHGFANLYKYFKEFDTVTLYDNSIAEGDEANPLKILLYLENGVIKLYSVGIAPEWVKKFADLCESK